MSERGLREECDEIWTLNDWYHLIPQIPTPDKVFNIHADLAPTNDPRRYVGDPIAEYNRSGAEIITMHRDARLTRNRVFDPSAWIDNRHDGFFSSSFAYMFLMAWQERVERIVMRGVKLCRGGEYRTQTPAVLSAIYESEQRGITVDAPHRAEWDADTRP